MFLHIHYSGIQEALIGTMHCAPDARTSADFFKSDSSIQDIMDIAKIEYCNVGYYLLTQAETLHSLSRYLARPYRRAAADNIAFHGAPDPIHG
jgi:hypothetical protein